MNNLTIILLPNKNKEPAAIIGNFYFRDWRYAIHFMIYINVKCKNELKREYYDCWCDKYLCPWMFEGDLNEFNEEWSKLNLKIKTSIGIIEYSNCIDLNKISAWAN